MSLVCNSSINYYLGFKVESVPLETRPNLWDIVERAGSVVILENACRPILYIMKCLFFSKVHMA